jgi:hypothetical protein
MYGASGFRNITPSPPLFLTVKNFYHIKKKYMKRGREMDADSTKLLEEQTSNSANSTKG